MGHDHDHEHSQENDLNTFYLDQLFTIAVCGALAAVAVMWWWTGKMELFLVPKYHPLVLFGGLMLLALVIIRAVALWRSVDEVTHGHEHHDCCHEHDHCHHDHSHGIQTEEHAMEAAGAATSLPLSKPVHEHEHEQDHGHHHGHDHEHGWAPWRYVVLLLPVVLFFLNLPNQGFSADASSDLSGLTLSGSESVRSTGRVNVGFVELQQASLSQESRDYYEGKTVTLTGQYLGYDAKHFTLRRYKMACCAADAVKLDAVIMVDDKSLEKVDPETYRNKWVQVTGRIRFFQKRGANEFMTGLVLYPTKDEQIDKLAKIIPPPKSPWVN